MANNIANQTKNAQVNSFTGGINTDLHPMLQPNNTLTDCVNGTLITYNGNENMLQNDMGNYALEGAKLPPNYVPIGVKEHAGILYVVAYNPLTKRTQIGSYPSPKIDFDKEPDGSENSLEVEPYKIKSIEPKSGPGTGEFTPIDFPSKVWGLIDGTIQDTDDGEGYHLYSNVVETSSKILEILGDMDNSNFQLTINDQYQLIVDINSDDAEGESSDKNPE